MVDKEPHFHVFQFKNTLANSPFGFKPLNPSYSEEVDSILLGVWSLFFIQLIQRAIVCYEINLLSKSLQPCPLVILFGVGLGLNIREEKKKKKKNNGGNLSSICEGNSSDPFSRSSVSFAVAYLYSYSGEE